MVFRKNLFRIFGLVVLLFSLFVSVFVVKNVVRFFSGAKGNTADLIIDASDTFSAPESWRNFAQGGEEKGRQLAPVLNQVKALKPVYIRIDHIYDYYNVVSKDPSGNLLFNWKELDLTVEDILTVGAKPFFSLSYMPAQISKNGDITDLPASWSDWEALVTATIEHYSSRSGLGIDNVYYEVWNEPDLFGDFKVYGEKNYLDLYYHSALAASRAKNTKDYKIGGPATTGLYTSWLKGLKKIAVDNNLRLDFLSWHRYTKSLDKFEKEITNIYSWLFENSAALGRVELIISELGPNSENDPVYDNSFGPIHAMAVAAILDGIVDKAFSFELKDGPGPEKFWGRWGLLTHEKFGEPQVKPRYSAFLFLNQMIGAGVYTKGEGEWVKAFSRKDGNIIRTLVVNYDVNAKHSEAVSLTFNNLPSRNFTLRRIDFMGEIKERSVATSSASWKMVEFFDPNTASIFELIPK